MMMIWEFHFDDMKNVRKWLYGMTMELIRSILNYRVTMECLTTSATVSLDNY